MECKGILTPEAIMAKNLKLGSDQAKDMFYRKHYITFYKVAFRILKSKTDAEDLVSEAFIKVFNKIQQLKDDAQLISWSICLLTRMSYTFLKTRRYDGDLEVYDPGMSENLAATLDLHLIQETMNRLPPGYRSVLDLHCIQGFDSIEIGEKLNIRPATVRSQISKGRKKLKSLLGYEY